MNRTRLMTAASAIALSAGPALADLTAEDVLADQLAQMEVYGLDAEVTGQSRSGSVLTVEGLTAGATTPDGSFSFTMGGASYAEQGDGTVVVTYPAEIPLTFKGSGQGTAFEAAMTIRQTGTELVVSGTPEQIRYEFRSEEFALAELVMIAPPEAAEAAADVSVVLKNLTGMMELSAGEVRNYTANFAVESLGGTLSGTDPAGSGGFGLEFQAADIAADYFGSIARQDIMGSLAESVRRGNVTQGTATYGPARYAITADAPEGSFEGTAEVGSGNVNFAMGLDGLDYGGTSRDLAVSFGGSAIPFPPLSFTMAEYGGRFAFPIVPSEEAQGFALRLSMIDLAVDPMLWAMIDPTEQLPRDPATIVVDVDGEAVLTEDVFDPKFAEEMSGPPGQINAVKINEVRLSLAGAALTGDGDFTFNNEMGFPMPAGVANLMLVGGNTLLDKLVGMGLVPEDQAMGARMMMGLFARPGDGEDTLVSTIEVMEDGSILANGQRIQ